ncbi:hypothetical protein D3C71_1781660 [compost metagenome]
MYISSGIVTQIQNNSLFIVLLCNHVQQEVFQLTTTHVFHVSVGNPVITELFYPISVLCNPFIVKIAL